MKKWVCLILVGVLLLLCTNMGVSQPMEDPCDKGGTCGECLSLVTNVPGSDGCGWCPLFGPFRGVCLSGTKAGPVVVQCVPSATFGNWTFGANDTAFCPPTVFWQWPMSGGRPQRSYSGSFPMGTSGEPTILWRTTLSESFFSGVLPIEPAVTYQGLFVGASSIVFKIDSVNGRQLFAAPLPSSMNAGAISIDVSGLVWVVDSDDVAVLSPDTGEILYHSGYGSNCSPLVPTSAASWASASGAIFAGPAGDVVSLSTELVIRWQTSLAAETNISHPDPSWSPIAFEQEHNLVFVGVNDARSPLGYKFGANYVVALSPNSGEVAWVTPVAGDVMSTAVYDTNTLIVSGWRYATVTALDIPTGNVLWTFSLGNTTDGYPLDPMPISAAPSTGAVLFGTANGGGFFALDAATGKPLWHRADVSSDSPALVVPSGQVFVVNGGHSLVSLDLSSGATNWDLPMRCTSVLSFQADQLLVTSQDDGMLTLLALP
jgi:outer membrane protein assembly factor BamB